MSKIVEFEWNLPLSAADDGKQMEISIAVDAPQLGSSILRKPNGEIVNGTVSKVKLGTGASLRGKTLRCQTLVTDLDKKSDATKVNFSVGDYSITYSEDVEKHGGSIMYKVTIKFS